MTEETKALALTEEQQQALARQYEDLIADAGRGTEAIGDNDVRPPRIGICQAGTPQRKVDNPKQIKGLNELDIFNDLTEENYGRGPLPFIVLRAMPPRYIEFAPMEEGGGVLDMDVSPDDPRTQFTTDPATGERHKPIATMFRDFLVFLPVQQEVAIMGMKGSQLKVAVQLNSKMKLPIKGELIDPALKGRIITDPPAWSRTFSVTSFMDHDATNSWGNYALKIEGLTPRELRDTCRQLADSYSKKNIITNPVEDEDVEFDPASLEREPASSEM